MTGSDGPTCAAVARRPSTRHALPAVTLWRVCQPIQVDDSRELELSLRELELSLVDRSRSTERDQTVSSAVGDDSGTRESASLSIR